MYTHIHTAYILTHLEFIATATEECCTANRIIVN